MADGNSKTPVGFSAELCQRVLSEIAKDLGVTDLKYEYTMVTPSNRIPLLQNGTIDIECSTTTNTKARAEQVGFAPTHFVAAITAAVRKDSGIQSIEDLNGKTVATVTGSTSIQLLRAKRRNSAFDVKEVSGRDTSDTFLMLTSGRADAMILEDVQLAGLIAQQGKEAEFTVLNESLRNEPYGFMYRKQDTEFGQRVDAALARIYASDDINQLYNKWFNSPTPPRNVNMHFAMPEHLKANYQNPNKDGV